MFNLTFIFFFKNKFMQTNNNSITIRQTNWVYI